MDYRRDIDGLRAVAVIPVMLFHAGVPGFAGGFVGVDVFFVISGFLITRMLLEDIARERFSILGFYDRRLRRIAPALVAMLLAVQIAALVLLAPGALRNLERSLVSTALFASNVFFYGEGGYFGAPAAGKPLLHTWSLSVEEQFYIAFPALLYVLRNQGRVAIERWLLAIASASLLLSLWRGHVAPEEAFYLPHTRVWELLLGSLLANRLPSMPTQRPIFAQALGIAGLALIAVAICGKPALPAPRVFAAFGAAQVIASGALGESTAKRVLGAWPLVAIGLISYSLYLWHWPLLVFAQYTLFRPLQSGEVAVAITATFAMALLSWRYVERPFRRSFHRPRRTVAIGLGAFACVACMSLAVLAASLWRALPPPYMDVAAAQRTYGIGSCLLEDDGRHWDAEKCFLTPRRDRNVLLWGDSFAAHYAHLLSDLPSGPGVLQYTTNGCPPAIGYGRASVKACRTFNDRVFEVARRYGVSTVVMAGRWAAYENQDALLDALSATLVEWARRGIRVVLVGQSEDFAFPFDDAERAAVLAYAHPDLAWRTVAFDVAINRRLQALAGEAGTTVFFDPMHVCRGSLCPLLAADEAVVIDHGHLSPVGSVMVGAPLREMIATYPVSRVNSRATSAGSSR